jgi:tryptophanyl-tRNA synthetase
LTVEQIAPMTSKMNEFMADPAEIDRILKDGSEKAGAIAEPILNEVMDVMGFWQT